MLEVFNEYVKQFDLKVNAIMKKYHHSLRVQELAIDIAKSNNMSDEDINLASLCGLFHDIARFKQWTDYETYNDIKSIDHGDLGYDIIKELIQHEEIELIANVIKYHNKKELPKLDDRTLMFLKIIKDADKIDILKTQCLLDTDEDIVLNKTILNDILNGNIANNKDCVNMTDAILRCISWVNEIYFDYSINYLKEYEIIKNKLSLLTVYGFKDGYKELEEYIIKRIGE